MLYGPVEKEQALKAAGGRAQTLWQRPLFAAHRGNACAGPAQHLLGSEATELASRRNSLRRSEARRSLGGGKRPGRASPRPRLKKSPARRSLKPRSKRRPSRKSPSNRTPIPAGWSALPRLCARKRSRRHARPQPPQRLPSSSRPGKKQKRLCPLARIWISWTATCLFEQQISRLAQPLSEGANRLTNDAPEPEEEAPQTVARFSGTPLVNVGEKLSARAAIRRACIMWSNGRCAASGMRSWGGTGQRDLRPGGKPDRKPANLHGIRLAERRHAPAGHGHADGKRSLYHGCCCRAAPWDQHLNATAAAPASSWLEIEADRISLLMQLETARRTKNSGKSHCLAFAEAARDGAPEKEVDRLSRQREGLEQSAPSARKTLPG